MEGRDAGEVRTCLCRLQPPNLLAIMPLCGRARVSAGPSPALFCPPFFLFWPRWTATLQEVLGTGQSDLPGPGHGGTCACISTSTKSLDRTGPNSDASLCPFSRDKHDHVRVKGRCSWLVIRRNNVSGSAISRAILQATVFPHAASLTCSQPALTEQTFLFDAHTGRELESHRPGAGVWGRWNWPSGFPPALGPPKNPGHCPLAVY